MNLKDKSKTKDDRVCVSLLVSREQKKKWKIKALEKEVSLSDYVLSLVKEG